MKFKAKIKAWRPKLPPKATEHVRHHFARYTPDLWLYSTFATVLTFVLALLLSKLFLSSANLSGQAIQTGQRVLIEVATGEVEGNARHTRQEEVKPKIAENAPPASNSKEALVKEGLAPAPLEAISQQTDKGLVPVIGKDGTLPWKYYSRPYPSPGKRPMVAIVITDLALSKPLTEDAMKLPRSMTLSFSPYAGDARKWAASAREAGFETLVDFPMQSLDYLKNGIDAGPYGLLAEADTDQNSARLLWVLSRFSGYVGVLAPENEGMTSNIAAIRPVLTELAAHGVLFLYIKTPHNSGFDELAKSRQFYALGIDKVIDDDIETGPIDRQLQALTELAKIQGYAVGFGHAYPPTLESLTRWSEGLSDQGVDLAPVSAIALKALP